MGGYWGGSEHGFRGHNTRNNNALSQISSGCEPSSAITHTPGRRGQRGLMYVPFPRRCVIENLAHIYTYTYLKYMHTCVCTWVNCKFRYVSICLFNKLSYKFYSWRVLLQLFSGDSLSYGRSQKKNKLGKIKCLKPPPRTPGRRRIPQICYNIGSRPPRRNNAL